MRIRNQFLLVSLSVSGVLLLALALMFKFSFEQGLDQYLAQRQQQSLARLAGEFAAYYRDYGSFEGVTLRALIWDAEGQSGPRIPPDLVVLDSERRPVIGPPVPPENLVLVPVRAGDRTVGWVGLPDAPEFREDLERGFERRQGRFIIGLSLIALAAAVVGAWWLSRKMVRPVERIAGFSERLARGDYQARLNLQRSDELGRLTTSMDSLAHALQQASQARERWLADISHELRTPVAVLRGEIEAMQDGIHPADGEHLALLHGQVMHLADLLNDLHDLALADAGALRYRFTEVDFAGLARTACAAAAPRLEEAGLKLSTWIPGGPLPIRGDALRLRQLLDNLLANSLKYTEAPGEVQVALTGSEQQVRLIVDDSAPSVLEEHLPRLFDYLFRAESSRSRATGGAGLGLAICRRIAEAHRGNVVATRSPLGGLRVIVTFPEQGT